MFMYVCMYVDVYVYVFRCVCVNVFLCIYEFMCMCVYIMYVSMCMDVCGICMYI